MTVIFVYFLNKMQLNTIDKFTKISKHSDIVTSILIISFPKSVINSSFAD